MRITKKPTSVKSSYKIASRKAVRADEEDVVVDPEATELLFETEDVAQLLAEVTESEVVVDVDEEGEEVIFSVDDDEYVVTPEGDEEILEASKRYNKKSVKAHASTDKVRSARKVR